MGTENPIEKLLAPAKAPAEMSLAELEAENNRLWGIRELVKAAQMNLAPFLDAASIADTAAKAAQADPTLNQRIG